MTKIQTLELCRKLWRWLEKNPNYRKEQWPGWKPFMDQKNHLNGYLAFENACPCCEYVSHFNNPINKCENCPLIGYAWYSNCMTEDSPYRTWYYANDRDLRISNAKIIADACTKALKDLREQKIIADACTKALKDLREQNKKGKRK